MNVSWPIVDLEYPNFKNALNIQNFNFGRASAVPSENKSDSRQSIDMRFINN
jgi:hypothetical protein